MRLVQNSIDVFDMPVNLEARVALSNRKHVRISGREHQAGFILRTEEIGITLATSEIRIIKVITGIDHHVHRSVKLPGNSVAAVFDFYDDVGGRRFDELIGNGIVRPNFNASYKYKRLFGSLEGLDRIVVQKIIDSGVDAQNHERNYLDDESGDFKSITAFVLAITLISIGWWHVRFNDGSVIRVLIGGFITLSGWLPRWYALTIFTRHCGQTD